MSNRNDGRPVHPYAPRSSEPHGISFTLIQPTPPTSPNLVANFPTARKRPSSSKLAENAKTKVKKNS
ncbi:hypothetical protein C2E23DRAFT_888748 [Lenzites betulinus]|nr:hypothetical protein C2E23DRAFT_888748 [Lenzites betulinus]